MRALSTINSLTQSNSITGSLQVEVLTKEGEDWEAKPHASLYPKHINHVELTSSVCVCVYVCVCVLKGEALLRGLERGQEDYIHGCIPQRR